MNPVEPEDDLLRSVALQNATSILLARERAEEGRREALEALRASEERLHAIFHQAAVGIAVADLGGRFVEMNQKFCDILGYSADELTELTLRHITHPDDLARTEKHLGELLAGEIPEFSLEKRYIRRDGGVVWSSTSVTVLRDAFEVPSRFVGVVQDITDRRAAEEALREESRSLELLNRTGVILAASKLNLKALVEAVTDAATEISGAEFGVFHFNTTGDLGDRAVEFLAAGTGSALAEPGPPPAAQKFAPGLLSNGPIRCADVVLEPRAGYLGLMVPAGASPIRSYLAVPVLGRAGGVIGGLFFGHARAGVFSERTERMVVGVAAQAAVAIDNARLYEAARQAADERLQLLESERFARAAAEKMSSLKDDFLAILSHELRTPLSAILGWTQVLRRGHQDAEDLQKGLETIERNARVQTRLIEELLDMSRVTSGKVRLDVQQLDPSSVVESAIESVSPSAEAKGIRIVKRFEPGAGPVSGDPGRLQQVVWNLLSNAIKFTPKGGNVEVLVHRVSSAVEISVSDTGIGIQPEFLGLVFERFRQVDSSSTRTHGGLGLGLSIVKHLVELHGGRVSARSAGRGCGATFSLQLPLSAVRSGALQEARQYPRSDPQQAEFTTIDLAGMKVMAVDDDLDARDLIRRVLTNCGAVVVTAGSAEEALRLVELERPDVLVSDIGMPDVDGFELLRRVRKLGPDRGGNMPVIALTAFARSEDRTRALQAGFQVHVSKPIEPAELVATVASVFGRSPGSR